jgi:septal ring factor EnvC (AmiA/AmiB activator)
MLKTALNAAGPLFATVGLYGIESSTLGMALLIIMALAVILNQLWTLFDKVRCAIRSPEADTSFITNSCGQYRREIGRTLDQLREEDARQDRLNREHFQRLERMVAELRQEMRETNKGTAECFKDILKAVSRLEGKVSNE